ncbi:MAG: recombination protein O N-terminal domain-containing protein [Muribaculaceae bacterium]|nr:recombination protein O N-terminal domain-containing protein [Muribaculaceae bacterium]
MFEPLNCIALRTVKYSDRNSILSVYTRQHGRMGLLVPAGASKAAARTRALSMPLATFDCVADIRPGRDIFTIRDLRPTGTPPSPSPLKVTLRLFTADILASLLREPQQDRLLYEFILSAATALSEAPVQACANFHICFLLHLQHFLGIEPDWSTFSTGAVFDMADGIFRPFPPLHNRILPSDEAEAAHRLRRMNFRNAGMFAMSRFERNRILDRLLEYYRLHFPGLGTVNSLDVLRTMFDY